MRHSLVVSALVVAAATAGCGSMPRLGNERAATPAQPSLESMQAAQLSTLVHSLQQLVQGSATEQAEVLASARAGYEQARQGPAALRYGLMLAAPAHPARDAVTAQRLLREVMARPELLSGIERALAIVELQRVDAELRISTEKERLVAELQRERDKTRTAPSSAALTRRLQAEAEENAKLKKELAEARAKLDAIANIERSSISDRPSGTEGRNP
jgi:hypothetical protein